MHTKKQLRRSITLRSNRCTRRSLTAASERHGLTMKSNKWGGIFCLTRPVYKCRAGRSGAGQSLSCCSCLVSSIIFRLQRYKKLFYYYLKSADNFSIICPKQKIFHQKR